MQDLIAEYQQYQDATYVCFGLFTLDQPLTVHFLPALRRRASTRRRFPLRRSSKRFTFHGCASLLFSAWYIPKISLATLHIGPPFSRFAPFLCISSRSCSPSLLVAHLLSYCYPYPSRIRCLDAPFYTSSRLAFFALSLLSRFPLQWLLKRYPFYEWLILSGFSLPAGHALSMICLKWKMEYFFSEDGTDVGTSKGFMSA